MQWSRARAAAGLEPVKTVVPSRPNTGKGAASKGASDKGTATFADAKAAIKGFCKPIVEASRPPLPMKDVTPIGDAQAPLLIEGKVAQAA
jgi:hypothetical protein